MKVTNGMKPTNVLILQTQPKEFSIPLQTIMRMCNTKVFASEDSVKFCFLELCILLSQKPESQYIIVSNDLEIFVRAFRVSQPEKSVFITSQKLSWPLSEAPWTKKLQFVPIN